MTDQWRKILRTAVSRVVGPIKKGLDAAMGATSLGESDGIWLKSVSQSGLVGKFATFVSTITGRNVNDALAQNSFGPDSEPQDFTPYGVPMDLSDLRSTPGFNPVLGLPPEVGDLNLDEMAEFIAEENVARVARGVAMDEAARGNARTKTWVTMRDPKVRHAHRPMDGVTIPVNEPFMVDGWPMMWPGSVTAPIELWINCRCTTILDQDLMFSEAGE